MGKKARVAVQLDEGIIVALHAHKVTPQDIAKYLLKDVEIIIADKVRDVIAGVTTVKG